MLKHFFAATCAVSALTGVALAGPSCCNPAVKSAAAKKPAVKLIEVRVCPIAQEAVSGNGSGSEVVGKYKVYFCCAGCKPAFDKLSPAAKTKKIEAALKLQKSKVKPA